MVRPLPSPSPRNAIRVLVLLQVKSKEPCRDFKKTGQCPRGKDCPWSHDTKRSPSPGKGRGKGGSSSAAPATDGVLDKKKIPCKFHALGQCKHGKKCDWKHAAPDAAPAADAAPKAKAKARSKSRGKKGGAPAAPCVLKSMIMAAAIGGASGMFSPAAPGVELQSFHGLNVSFGDTTVYKIPAYGAHELTPGTWHNHDYKHPDWFHKLDSEACASVAALQAAKLASQLGFSETVDPAMAAAYSGSGPNRWLADTGCGFDLVSENDVSEELSSLNRKSSKPLALNTANGEIVVDREAAIQIPGLQEPVVHPFILEITPAVLSVGRRCMKLGYDFIWRRFRRPCFVRPDGKKTMLVVENDVP